MERHYRAILAYALRRTLQAEDAQDVVADTFLVAWRRRDEIVYEAALPWLYGVARRVLANHARGRRRRDHLAAELGRLPAPARELEAQVRNRDETRAVLAALARLRPLDQEVLRLAAWEELSANEIAAALGTSPNAVAIRVHRARERLRNELLKEAASSGHEADEGKEAQGTVR